MKDFHADNTEVADGPIGPGCSKVGSCYPWGKLLSSRYTDDKIY